MRTDLAVIWIIQQLALSTAVEEFDPGCNASAAFLELDSV
jgi:hypothetical protein